MGQVSRENKRTFHQRNNEHRDHGHWHDRNEFAHHTGNIEQRHKRDDRRCNGGDDTWKHLRRAVNRGFDKRQSFFPFGVNIFTNHDRVIDHDS